MPKRRSKENRRHTRPAAVQRDQNVARRVEKIAEKIRFTSPPPASAAALMQDFRRRGSLSGSVTSHLRHQYTNYDRLAQSIANRHGVPRFEVPREALHRAAARLIWDYLRTIKWSHGVLSPFEGIKR